MEGNRKKSRKRDAIMDVLRETKSHPSVEWIYAQLKPVFPDLSLGTVYRNLAQFKSDGEIIVVANVAGQDRYDANTSEHPHFICDSCGVVIDVEAELPFEVLKRAVEGETGYTVSGVDVIYRGLCEKCEEN